MEPTPFTGSLTFDHVLAFLGALVPLMSALAAFLNHKVRVSGTASPFLLNAAAAVNVLAVNVDKATQLAKLARGLPVPSTPAPAAPAVVDVGAAAVEPAPAGQPEVCPTCGR
jgi:hypothetical protein